MSDFDLARVYLIKYFIMVITFIEICSTNVKARNPILATVLTLIGSVAANQIYPSEILKREDAPTIRIPYSSIE